MATLDSTVATVLLALALHAQATFESRVLGRWQMHGKQDGSEVKDYLFEFLPDQKRAFYVKTGADWKLLSDKLNYGFSDDQHMRMGGPGLRDEQFQIITISDNELRLRRMKDGAPVNLIRLNSAQSAHTINEVQTPKVKGMQEESPPAKRLLGTWMHYSASSLFLEEFLPDDRRQAYQINKGGWQRFGTGSIYHMDDAEYIDMPFFPTKGSHFFYKILKFTQDELNLEGTCPARTGCQPSKYPPELINYRRLSSDTSKIGGAGPLTWTYKDGIAMAGEGLGPGTISEGWPSAFDIEDQARRISAYFWLGQYGDCGDSYGVDKHGTLFQIKNITPSIRSYGLSESDQLNGYRWSGHISMEGSSYRIWTKETGWNLWQSRYETEFRKILNYKGRWYLDKQRFFNDIRQPFLHCSELPQ